MDLLLFFAFSFLNFSIQFMSGAFFLLFTEILDVSDRDTITTSKVREQVEKKLGISLIDRYSVHFSLFPYIF